MARWLSRATKLTIVAAFFALLWASQPKKLCTESHQAITFQQGHAMTIPQSSVDLPPETIQRLSSSYALHLMLLLNSMYKDLEVQVAPVRIFGVTINPLSISIPKQLIELNVPPKAFTAMELEALPTPSVDALDCRKADHARRLAYGRSFFVSKPSNQWEPIETIEVLAAGAIPSLSSEQRDQNSFLPKKVLSQLQDFPGLNAQLDSKDELLYIVAVQKLLEYTRKVLSTESMAAYVLKVARVAPKARVLFLFSSKKEVSLLTASLLHGLKSTMGVGEVVDYPAQEWLVNTMGDFDEVAVLQSKAVLPRGGASYAKLLIEHPKQVNRELLERRVVKGEFDFVIVDADAFDGNASADIVEVACATSGLQVAVIHSNALTEEKVTRANKCTTLQFASMA